MSVVVLGSLVMDLVARTETLPRPGQSVLGTAFYQACGGKGANQAVAARRMGAKVALIGCVGADGSGTALRDGLEREGLDTGQVRTVPGAPSGCALISVAASGENSIVIVPGANLEAGAPELAALDGALGGARVLLLQLEVPMAVNVEAARRAAARGIPVILDPGPAQTLPPELLPLCALVTPNASEAEVLTGRPVRTLADAQAAAQALLGAGARQAIVKLGAQGGWYALDSGNGAYAAVPVRAVDSVAAGDAFNGALAAGLAAGQSWREALEWARAAGALAVTRPGAQPSLPRRAEVLALLRTHGPLAPGAPA